MDSTFISSTVPFVRVPVLSKHIVSTLANDSAQYKSLTNTSFLDSLIALIKNTELVNKTNPSGIIDITAAADATTALAYRGVSSAITLEDDVLLTATAADNHFKDVATAGNIKLLSTKSTETDNKLLWKLSAGITKVRIYMYVEGQDVDCENAASGSNLSFDLQFTQLAS